MNETATGIAAKDIPKKTATREDSGLFREAWRILRADRTAFFGFFIIIGLIGVAVLAPWIAPYGYTDQHIIQAYQGPSREFLLGTDEFGRDLLSRMIWGTRPALIVGVLSVLVSIGISHIAQYVRLARGPTMALRNHDFVRATRALGAGDIRITFKHILPNIIGPIIIMGTLSIAGAIRMEASLSFLGLGIQPPTPSWGNMIREGVANILQSPWMALFPGLALTVTVLAYNMVGDSLRDMFDPRTVLGGKPGAKTK